MVYELRKVGTSLLPLETDMKAISTSASGQQQKIHDQSSSSPERGFVWFKMRPDPDRSYSRCQTCAVFDLNGQAA